MGIGLINEGHCSSLIFGFLNSDSSPLSFNGFFIQALTSTFVAENFGENFEEFCSFTVLRLGTFIEINLSLNF
jgi:hypothetical protein